MSDNKGNSQLDEPLDDEIITEGLLRLMKQYAVRAGQNVAASNAAPDKSDRCYISATSLGQQAGSMNPVRGAYGEDIDSTEHNPFRLSYKNIKEDLKQWLREMHDQGLIAFREEEKGKLIHRSAAITNAGLQWLNERTAVPHTEIENATAQQAVSSSQRDVS